MSLTNLFNMLILIGIILGIFYAIWESGLSKGEKIFTSIMFALALIFLGLSLSGVLTQIFLHLFSGVS